MVAYIYKKPLLLLFLFVLAAYLPVLLPYFHLKNDILTQNLPTRFVFSESLYSGFKPYWNPFINFGIPQYGDMNNGFWNPVQWLIASTTGYNIYTITFEEIFYILTGGWGIYLTAREMFSKEASLLTALAYISCGYITGHMQYLCWITGTAFFPFVLLYFIRAQKSPRLKNFLAGGISVFLFTASTHPGLVIGAGYFFVFMLFAVYFNRKQFFKNFYQQHFWKTSLLFLLTGCVLSSMVIVSNFDVIQHISRGSKVSVTESLMAPTTWPSYLSVLLPLPVHKGNFFSTDIAMRNVYVGLGHLTGIILIAGMITRRMLLTIVTPLLFFMLLSAGGAFKIFAWKFLPLLGYVRLNGEFTYFVILLLLLAGTAGLEKLLSTEKRSGIANILFKLMLFLCIVAVAGGVISHSSVLFNGNPETGSLKRIIKNLVSNTSFWDLLFIQVIIQALTLKLVMHARHKGGSVIPAYSINLILITWLTLPFTGLGMMSKQEVQRVINQFPRGIGKQPLVSINDAEYIRPAEENQFLLISSYSKKIGYIKPDQYPVRLRTDEAFESDSVLTGFIRNQSYIFLSSDTSINANTSFDSSLIKVEVAGPGYIKCTVTNDRFNWLVLLQNDYPYWKVFKDGKHISHVTVFKTFIGVPMEPGTHHFLFQFSPAPIRLAMWVNLGLLLFAVLACLFPVTAAVRVIK